MALLDSATPISEPVAGVDSTGTVVQPFPCRKCSYSLLGLKNGGLCPECGTPISFSLKGDLLRFSQPEWLETLRSGVNLVLCSVLVDIFGVILMTIVSAVIWRHLVPLTVEIPMLIGALLSLVGSWRLTTPDPSGLGEDQYGTSRRLIRIGIAVGLANHAISFLRSQTTLSPVQAEGAECLSIAIQLIGVVALFAQLFYLSKLAMRLPDEKLSKRAKGLMYAFGFSQSFFVAITAIRHFPINRQVVPRHAGTSAILLLSMTTTICLFVFGLMYLSMLTKFGKRFKEAAANARSTWLVPTA